MAIPDLRGRDNLDNRNLANLLTKVFWLNVSFGALFYFAPDEFVEKVSFVLVLGEFGVFVNIEIHRHSSYMNFFNAEVFFNIEHGIFRVQQE